jgi:hypothetical protein
MIFELLQVVCYLLTTAYIVFFFYNRSNDEKIMRERMAKASSLFLNIMKPVAESIKKRNSECSLDGMDTNST